MDFGWLVSNLVNLGHACVHILEFDTMIIMPSNTYFHLSPFPLKILRNKQSFQEAYYCKKGWNGK